MPDSPEERLAFDRVAEIYDRVRPVYPELLFDDLFARLVVPGPQVVEIGAGTGKATASLLGRGASVTAVEPGPNMAAFLRRKFGRRLQVVNETFEGAELPAAAFDAIFAATSWHWVNQGVRLRKAHDLLSPEGALAVVSTNQIASDTDHGYFARSQGVYRRFFPEEDVPHLHGEDLVPEEFEEIEGSTFFGRPQLFRYRWDQSYATADYADLMRSYSNMQVMPETDRETLIGELSDLIDREFGGIVTRPLVITLTLARKEASS